MQGLRLEAPGEASRREARDFRPVRLQAPASLQHAFALQRLGQDVFGQGQNVFRTPPTLITKHSSRAPSSLLIVSRFSLSGL